MTISDLRPPEVRFCNPVVFSLFTPIRFSVSQDYPPHSHSPSASSSSIARWVTEFASTPPAFFFEPDKIKTIQGLPCVFVHSKAMLPFNSQSSSAGFTWRRGPVGQVPSHRFFFSHFLPSSDDSRRLFCCGDLPKGPMPVQEVLTEIPHNR